MTSPLYGWTPGGSSLSLTMGEYDPGITKELDYKIRNMPFIIEYLHKMAEVLRDATGSDNFEIVMSTWHSPDPNASFPMTRPAETQRPRAYVTPSNSNGVREELGQGVLLKAALGMNGAGVSQ